MTNRPTHADLVALALGALDPARREQVESWLRTDEILERRYRDIQAHLAAYDELPEPAAPPFEAFAHRLGVTSEISSEVPSGAPSGAPSRPSGRRWRWAGAVAAATAIVVFAVLLGRPGRPPAAPGWRTGAGLVLEREGRVVDADSAGPGDVLRAADVNVPLSWPGRVEAVLSKGSVVVIGENDSIELRAGEAFFDVAVGPFAVETPRGRVAVKGTVFEMRLDPRDGLIVRVAEGEVDVDGVPVRAGEERAAGTTRASSAPAGDWFRHPTLELETGDAVAGANGRVHLRVRIRLRNPGLVPQSIPRADGVRTSLWLEVITPSGAVHDLPVSGPPWRGGEITDEGWRLPPHAEVERTFPIPASIGSEKGVYRCRAMYRPEGRAPLISDVLRLEVR